MSTQMHTIKNNTGYFSQTSKGIFLSNVNADKHKNYLSMGFSNTMILTGKHPVECIYGLSL